MHNYTQKSVTADKYKGTSDGVVWVEQGTWRADTSWHDSQKQSWAQIFSKVELGSDDEEHFPSW